DGIKNKIDPGPASDKDLYDLPPEELAAIPTVCGSLREAPEELAKDMDFLLAGDVFTSEQLESYMALKWEEVYAYEHTPHPIEYAMYYRCRSPPDHRERAPSGALFACPRPAVRRIFAQGHGRRWGEPVR